MQSQRMFPWGVWIRMARWPMANWGTVTMEVRRGSEGKGWNSLRWLPEERRVERVVKEGPVGRVYSGRAWC